MVCSICHGAFPHSHNRATCPWAEKNGGPRPLNQKQFLQPKKVKKSLEGLYGCMNIFKEPKSFYTPKKVTKPLEGLAGCMNIFKEPVVRKTKKVKRPLEGLSGCINIFKEPKGFYTATSGRTRPSKSVELTPPIHSRNCKELPSHRMRPMPVCGICGIPGHNRRTCSHLKSVVRRDKRQLSLEKFGFIPNVEVIDDTSTEGNLTKSITSFLDTQKFRWKTITVFDTTVNIPNTIRTYM